jgi:hypothetical protein
VKKPRKYLFLAISSKPNQFFFNKSKILIKDNMPDGVQIEIGKQIKNFLLSKM